MAAKVRLATQVVLAVLALSAVAARDASAQTRTATMTAAVNGLARLTLSATGVSFADANPDLVPLVPGTPSPLVLTVKARTTLNATLRLSVLASDDLRSGVRTIPATTITWTATGAGFVAGTLSRTTPQTVGTWVNSGARTGNQSLFFANSWTHPIGTYTLTMTYTLSSP
jgi:hypothetical protein